MDWLTHTPDAYGRPYTCFTHATRVLSFWAASAFCASPSADGEGDRLRWKGTPGFLNYAIGDGSPDSLYQTNPAGICT